MSLRRLDHRARCDRFPQPAALGFVQLLTERILFFDVAVSERALERLKFSACVGLFGQADHKSETVL
jgi:hypothetical protein